MQTPPPTQPSSTSFATAPIHVLLGAPLHTLTPDQLREVNQRSRALRASPSVLAKSIRDEQEQQAKPRKAKAEPKVDTTKVANSYL